MKRIRLEFDVKDKEYFDNLSDYIRLNYGRYFLINENQKDYKADYLISDYKNKRNKNNIIIKDGGDIEKYQKASLICSQLFQICNIESLTNKKNLEKEANVICVTSGLGGVGKSTVAKALCCRMAENGEDILYINMNPMSSGEAPFVTQDKNSITELFCFVYGKEDYLNTKVKTIAQRDEKRRVDYITNAKPSTDGFLNDEQAEFFTEQLKTKEFYSTIILDVPLIPTEGYIGILKNSINLLYIKDDSENKRQENILRYLKKKIEVPIIEVKNFTDGDGLALPQSRNIFDDRPAKFWQGIDRIIETIGSGNG